jgi:TonB family protein
MYRSFRYAVILVALLSFASVMTAEIRVTTPDALKAALKKTAPEYPSMAKQLRIVGHVEVDVVIDADGNVEAVKVLTGNAMLTPGVISAVKKWKFTPFTLEGAPSKAVASLNFDFKM